MPRSFEEEPLLRGQRRCGRRVGEQAEDRESAKNEREQDMISFGGALKEGCRGLEEVGKGVFVVQEDQEEFRAAFRAKKCRKISRGEAAGDGDGGGDDASLAGRFSHTHERALQREERGADATARASRSTGAPSDPAAFPCEENAEAVRFSYIKRPENKRIVVGRMGHAGKGGRRQRRAGLLQNFRRMTGGGRSGLPGAAGAQRRRGRGS